MIRLLSVGFLIACLPPILQPAAAVLKGAPPELSRDTVRIQLKPSPIRANKHLGGMPGVLFPLSKELPPGLKKGVNDPSARYGILPSRVTANGVFVAVTEADDSESGKLFVDLNGDGDLTNDPEPRERGAQWQLRGPVAFQAEREVLVGNRTIRLSFFRYTEKFAKDQIHLQKFNNPLFVHRDDVLEGEAKFLGRDYSVMLFDRGAHGRFDYQVDRAEPGIEPGQVLLYIDRDQNGKFDRKYEEFDLAKPFTLNGVTYELAALSLDGSELTLREAKNSVPEIPLPLNAIGSVSPAFQSKLLNEGEIRFPGDYKGKIVLISFWATWCEPCVGRLPELKATWDRLNSQGVEIIGVCLDQEPDRDKALAVCEKFGVKWPQAFDGQGTNGKIAKSFGVHAVPAYIVVDGTTGRVLAPPDEVKSGGIDDTLNRILVIRDVLSGK